MSAGAADGGIGAVYVHAPFCARRCSYCDFAVTVRRSADPEDWASALAAELALSQGEERFALGPRLSTVYVGGGTPSLLGPDAMRAVNGVLGPERLAAPDLEWTAEANPESLTRDVAEAWRSAGVNRLSVGAQTFHEDALRWMGRLHGSEGPARALALAREAGIANVSLDLIFGLPARLGRSWRADLERVLSLDVPHVSLYGLTVESATPLGRAVSEGREGPVDDAQYEEEYLLAAELLRAAGYEHYEVSSFARPGARSRHNEVYWSGAPYLGLGNGAHSYAAPVRRWNVRDWKTYRGLALAGRSPEEGRETVEGVAVQLEEIWLALRTDAGLRVASDRKDARAVVRRWERGGLAERVEDAVRLTPNGWLQLDRLAVELDGAWRAG